MIPRDRQREAKNREARRAFRNGSALVDRSLYHIAQPIIVTGDRMPAERIQSARRRNEIAPRACAREPSPVGFN